MKANKLRRILALSLAVMLAAAVFAGCSGADGSASPAASPSSSAGEGGTASESGDSPASELPRTTLTVEVFDRANENGTDPTNNYWTDWIKEQMLDEFNIEVNFLSVPRTEEVPQLNVLMAGGSPPDIVFTYTKSVAYNYFRQGGLADLTDIIEEHGQELKSYLGDEILSYGEFEGRQYLVPAKRVALGTYNTFMRKDWLDAVGLDVPTNMDEFYNALAAFRDNGVGVGGTTIPYSTHQKGIVFNTGNILDAFVELDNMTEEEKFVLAVSQDGQSTTMLYPGFKEGIRFLNKLYNEGLLDPEFALYKEYDEVEQGIMRGQVGAWTSNYDSPIRTSPGVYNQLKENVPEAEIVVLDCFNNVVTDSALRQSYEPVGIYSFVPASSGNVEGAIKYLSWLTRDEVRNYLVCGEEGVNHELDDEGIPVMINLQNDNRMMNSPNNLDYAIIVNGVDLGDTDRNLKAIAKSYEEQYEDWFMDAYHTSMNGAKVYNPVSIPFETEAQYTTTLNEKRHEIMTAAITASEDNFDTVYDNGVAEWMAVGGQACLDERQAYWDEYLA